MEKNELISLYFSNKLSNEDLKEFNRLLEIDDVFASEVAFQKDIKQAIRAEEHAITKSKLQAIEAREKASTFNYKKWLVAASIVALLCISGIWMYNSRTPNTEQLYANYFVPYRNVVHPILRGETDETLKTKAFKAYERKKYQEALNYFNQLLAIQDNETIAFYKANVLLQLGNPEDAILIFTQQLITEDALKAKTHWYLALAYLKQNNIDKAVYHLQKLRNLDDTFKAIETQELLKKLN